MRERRQIVRRRLVHHGDAAVVAEVAIATKARITHAVRVADQPAIERELAVLAAGIFFCVERVWWGGHMRRTAEDRRVVRRLVANGPTEATKLAAAKAAPGSIVRGTRTGARSRIVEVAVARRATTVPAEAA